MIYASHWSRVFSSLSLLLLGFLFVEELCAQGFLPMPPRGTYLNRDSVAILEVEDAKLLHEKASSIPTLKVRTYEVAVIMRAACPNQLREQRYGVHVQHEAPPQEGYIGPRGRLNLQDWFPIEKGKRLVAAFDAKDIQNAGKMVFIASGDKTDSAWFECEQFAHGLARQKDGMEAMVQKLADNLKANPKKLGRLYFQLIGQHGYLPLFDYAILADGAAGYLANREVPLAQRLGVIEYIGESKFRAEAAEKVLAHAAFQAILEADSAGVSKFDIATSLHWFAFGFIGKRSSQRPTQLPLLDEKARRLLRSYGAAQDLGGSPTGRQLLRDWADGKLSQ